MKRLLAVLLLLAGCATTGGADQPSADPRAAAHAQVTQALAGLPSCQPGAEVGALKVKATTCTRMFCSSACCNRCSWSASWESMSGARDASVQEVQRLLKVSDSALDCEVAAWAQALDGQSVALEAPSCMVR
jgi:curli biogenesis system outer membrane secretion channel CsgG